MISAPVTRTATLYGPRVQVRLTDTVPPYLRSLLRQVEPFPAAIRDGRWQLLAFNRSYDALFGLFFELVPPASRNALLIFFTDPRIRRQLPEWEVDAPRLVSRFRAAMARHPHDPAWTLLLDQLRCGSPEFERLWQDGGAFLPGNAPQRFLHPGRSARSGWLPTTCGPSRAPTVWSPPATPPLTLPPPPNSGLCPGV